ncbi:MAG: hypothetical protein ACOYXN_09705 [Acidobacteriota bacterium]
MLRSEKNFLERIADIIPGLAGYRAREDRRTTDKRLREYLAARLDRVRDQVESAKLQATNAGQLAVLNDLGLLHRKLQGAADSVRFASYGYTGLFDQVKIGDAELEALYAHDLKILEAVEALESAAADALGLSRSGMNAVVALEGLLAERRNLWEKG